ncbi:MAG: cyclase family protein, partial [Phascolarctobacterium sp.]|nr:cyclase family protein [Phascolarctobacterium sp.]
MKIIDISQEVFSCNVYPGDPHPTAEKVVSIDNGDVYNMSTLSMCVHNGTHIDAPYHFLNDGNTVEQIPLEYFVGTCYVTHRDGELTANDAEEIMQEAIADNAPERILIGGNVTVTAEAAKVFAEHGIKLIGNEGLSIGPVDAPMEVHKILLSTNVVLLE